MCSTMVGFTIFKVSVNSANNRLQNTVKVKQVKIKLCKNVLMHINPNLINTDLYLLGCNKRIF